MAGGVTKPDRACSLGCGNRVPKVGPTRCQACRDVLAAITADQKRAKMKKPPPARVGVAYTRGRAMSANMRGAW